jgi:multimeric flavodoxin WrbA
MTSALAGRLDDVLLFKLRELAIAPCTGCFGCWTRTPGECVVEDSARDILDRAGVTS